MTAHLHALPTHADRRRHVAEVEEGDLDLLRPHLAEDHGLPVYDDDTDDALYAMHDAAHRAAPPEPPAPAQPQVPEAVEAARAELQLYGATKAEEAYDVVEPDTLRERIAYAGTLAVSGLVPKAFRSGRPGDDGWRETRANIVLAMELGRTLDLSPLQALCQVNVVEGKPSLGAEGQLAQVLKAGHDLDVDDDSNADRAIVHAQRYQDGEPVGRRRTITYTLEDAQRAGLVRMVDGKPFARSAQGKPLPWETSTPDMLVWRAVTRACKRVFPDIVGGLAANDDDNGPVHGPPGTTVTAAQVSQEAPARARRAESTTDSVEADLELFTEDTGPWWQHAGAQVRRRNKLQLAADRLQDALDAGDDRVPTPRADDDLVVDAELVPDPAPAPTEAAPEVVVDMAAEADALQAEVEGQGEPAVADGETYAAANARDAAEPATVTEPLVDGTVAHLTGAPEEAMPVEDPPYDDQEGDTVAPGEDMPAATDRAAVWAEVEALAAERGKTPAQLLARHTLATRTNPEDMTAEQLQAFLTAQRGL